MNKFNQIISIATSRTGAKDLILKTDSTLAKKAKIYNWSIIREYDSKLRTQTELYGTIVAPAKNGRQYQRTISVPILRSVADGTKSVTYSNRPSKLG